MADEHPTARVIDDILHLDVEGVIEDPVLRRMANCARELRPMIEGAAGRHGYGTTMATLIAIVANMALDRGDEALIADAFRQSAEMLDVGAEVGVFLGRA